MSGFPFSGKSFVVDRVLAQCADLDILLISPKEYKPNNYDDLDEESKKEVNICMWSCSLDVLRENIINHNNEIIIYDTSCASYDSMNEYFKLAIEYKHKVVYVFVMTDLELCKKRAGNKWLPNVVIQKYKDNFKQYLNKFRELSNIFMIINNNGNPDVSKLVRVIKSNA